MLSVDVLDVAYGQIRALKGVALAVGRGEIVALLGNNGAGKTTTLKTISGLLRPTSGTITLEGQPLAGVPPHEIVMRGLAHVPEGRRIFNRLTVRENLVMGALAPVLVEQIFDTIVDINRQGTTILLVEQNAAMALSIAHRGYVLETGSIALAGTAAELSDNADVRRAYLGE